MIKFFCRYCETEQPVQIQPMNKDSLNPESWGDILCSKCMFILATVTVDEAGIYDFVKVAEVNKNGNE